MKLATNFVLLTATASIASAWSLIAYKDGGQQGDVVISDSGSATRASSRSVPCRDINVAFNDQVSSFTWQRGPNEFCVLTLYESYGCVDRVLLITRADRVQEDLDSWTNDKASSWSVRCY